MIASNRDSLCMNLLRAKYKVKHNLFHTEPPKLVSYTWKAIEKAEAIILQGACYLIGDGSLVSVWEDPWVPWIQGFSPKPREDAFSQIPMLVSQLINNELRYWNAYLVNEIFDAESTRAILSISLPFQPCPDKLIWVLDPKGRFTIKSAYRATTQKDEPSPIPQSLWKKIWKFNAPKRIKMFLWRIVVDVLPTRENFSKRVEITDCKCILCVEESDTLSHVFFRCPVARALWFACCWGFRADEVLINSNQDIIKMVLEPPNTPCPDNDK